MIRKTMGSSEKPCLILILFMVSILLLSAKSALCQNDGGPAGGDATGPAATNPAANTDIDFLPKSKEVVQGKVHKQPSEDARVVGFVRQGEMVTVFLRIGNWYAVRFGEDMVGWVPKRLFETLEPFEAPEEEEFRPGPQPTLEDQVAEELILAVVPAGLRENPNPEENPTSSLNGTEKLKLIHTKGPWLRVELESGGSGWIHSNFVAMAKAGEKPGQTGPAMINAIGADTSEKDMETVKVDLDRVFVPETFVLEGDRPRIVCDFFGATLHPDVKKEIAVNGQYIEKIRIGAYENPEKKIRIVLDLAVGKDYEVQQVFFEKESLFSLSVLQK